MKLNIVKTLRSNGKIARVNGNTWRITSVSLIGRILADVECVAGFHKGERLNLVRGRCATVKAIRNLIELGLLS